MASKCVVLVTGASSGFGAMTVRELAKGSHTVFAGMFGNFPSAREDAATFAQEHRADLRTVELDVTSEASIKSAVDHIIKTSGRLDTVIHNAGHMGYGPAEAFTPEQFLHMFEINTLGTQRVNRVVLPHMRRARQGHVVWVSSSSARGGGSPFLAPYFAAKAAMDSLAQSYATELSQWGIDSTIVVPGIFTTGTAHFKTAASPADKDVLREYQEGPYKGVMEKESEGSSKLPPPDADPETVARVIRKVVELPRGERPFRYGGPETDLADDGSTEVNAMADKMRRDWLRRIGLPELLKTRIN